MASAPLFIPSLPLGSDLVEGIIIKKKDRLALLSHRRISIGIAVFFHFAQPLSSRPTPNFPKHESDPSIVRSFLIFVIYGDIAIMGIVVLKATKDISLH